MVDRKFWWIIIGILIILGFIWYFSSGNLKFSPSSKHLDVKKIASARYCQCGESSCIEKDIGEIGDKGVCDYKQKDKLCDSKNPLKGYNCISEN